MAFGGRYIWEREPRRLEVFMSAIHELLEKFHLHFFLASVFPEADRGGLLENLITTNWPDSLLQRYSSTDMFRQSKIVARLKSSVLPVSSEELLFARAEREGSMVQQKSS